MTPEQILQRQEHRPWPLPRSPWIMRQTWNDLLFAHWSLAPEALRPLVPPELSLDLYSPRTLTGLTQVFKLLADETRMRILHYLMQKPELNVRTYVTYQGKPGVFFFSLDAFNPPAVWGARLAYHLPYFYARMWFKTENGGEFGTREVQYSSMRFRTPHAEFKGVYKAASAASESRPGSVEHFVTERYRLYSVHEGNVYAADIHHVTWQLQTAEATITRNSMAEAAGISLPHSKPLLHFSKRMKVLVWPIRRL